MTINPYLFFNNQCKEAFEFYAELLGGNIVMMMTAEGTPAEQHVPPEYAKQIMHARILIGDQVLMGSDAHPDHLKTPEGFRVSVVVDEASEAERIFHALAEGGNVEMPIEETFWAVRFGMLTDRFGIPWMVNCEKQP